MAMIWQNAYVARTTNPATYGRPDSWSSSFVPTLPISGAVMHTICSW